MAAETKYDLLLKGGQFIDPASGRRGNYDVAFSGDRVAAIEPDIDPSSAGRVQNVDGTMVVPGLIDMHVHSCEGVGGSIAPDAAGLDRGTTTIVDGGTCGAGNFGIFHWLRDSARTRTLAWLNVSTVGLTDGNVGECQFLHWMDVDRATATAKANADTIVGFKARLST